MKNKNYSTQGLVISRRNYKEADRILVVFTKTFGKIRLLAKGVRKPKSRKRGHLEVFSKIRFSATALPGLDLITEVETLKSFDLIRNDLRKVAVAYYFLEVTDKLTKEAEKQDNILDLLLGYISKLEEPVNLRQLRKKFIFEILIELGFWPPSKKMSDPDSILDQILERRVNSFRVGKKLLG